ncbi:MAG: hypothetical protein CMO80_11475 [Verrucomicrobiales bacterium]|nr:hypothetical protein [Verrucomicrobiales bacterium]|tara:strand:- start:403 stop:606 length:204 start_codon:yes stop_codon:yes gene_type:complete
MLSSDTLPHFGQRLSHLNHAAQPIATNATSNRTFGNAFPIGTFRAPKANTTKTMPRKEKKNDEFLRA